MSFVLKYEKRGERSIADGDTYAKTIWRRRSRYRRRRRTQPQHRTCFFVIFTTVVVGVRDSAPCSYGPARALGSGAYTSTVMSFFRPSRRITLGLRLGLSVGSLVIVASEFIAADTGLGHLINYSRRWFRVSDILAGAITIGLLASNHLLVALEKRMFRWRASIN